MGYKNNENRRLMRIALDKIANSPTPYNEREMQSWYETARQISIKALSGQSDVEGS
jgi:hypothetical protein